MTRWLVPTSAKLVAFLQGAIGPAYSGKFIRKLLEANLCRINGKIERFGSSLVNKGDFVELASSWKSLSTPPPIHFETVYEDAFLKIINKPANWVCEEKTVIKTFGPNHFLTHRLDKDTTGLLIIAKNSKAKEAITKLFEERKIGKTYLALVDGIPKDKEGIRKTFLAKKGAFQGQTIWGSSSRGLTAITHWELASSGKNCALLQCKPETGRTHQIRVHLAEIGHPILIDRQYAKTFRCKHFFQRPLLHASQLVFTHPLLNIQIDIRARLPPDFSEAIRLVGCELSDQLGFYFL